MIKVYKYPDLDVPDETPYQLQIDQFKVGAIFRDFALAQEVFDFIEEKFSGESVDVHIKGDRTIEIRRVVDGSGKHYPHLGPLK